jgi:hypothetical protein
MDLYRRFVTDCGRFINPAKEFVNRTRFLGHYLSLKLLVLSIDDVCIPQGS